MAKKNGDKKSIFNIFIAKLKGQDDMVFPAPKKEAPVPDDTVKEEELSPVTDGVAAEEESVPVIADVVEKGEAVPAAADVAPKQQASTFTFGNVAKAIVFLLICFIMISPLKSCVFTDGDYIGRAAAQKIALDDAGIISDTAKDMQTEMVKLDDGYYYKVQFTGSVTDYRYIIDADSGEILARAFYHIQGES